jgi:hypothetical protein
MRSGIGRDGGRSATAAGEASETAAAGTGDGDFDRDDVISGRKAVGTVMLGGIGAFGSGASAPVFALVEAMKLSPTSELLALTQLLVAPSPSFSLLRIRLRTLLASLMAIFSMLFATTLVNLSLMGIL